MSHPWSSDFDEFLAILLASRLVTLEEIRNTFTDFAQETIQSMTIDELGHHLVGHDIITSWQFGKLRDGRFKGFYIDKYLLLEQIARDEYETTFRARDTASNAIVKLAVKPLDGPPHYTWRIVDD